ncbi:hypothetical protein HS961_14735 [Comamonas piscis]|uniref:Uncharacterized protein n=1 Tax=Comamonas piscis TaxID=1562974 RepID=A0A7G5EJ19_9BURK|nr:hypothetical protein [Comamonas piscis]QMV73994.1 hypothetical protein HS961_14735 [Comamonas piscis]WSO32422.1 hypothetical protein VUJ63_14775 [Comamonas piscis]
MPDSRIPPKFVPTLTEEAVQDAADALPFVAPGGAVAPAPDSIPPSVDVLRRRRDADAQASGAWAQPAADIADLPTYSGWAQQADAALPLGSGAQAFAAPAHPVEGSSLPSWMPDQGEAVAPPSAGAGAVVDDSDGQPAHSLVQSALGGEGVAVSDATSHLVESAAETAQALEDAITRRVTRRVQETLDARLSAAVLKVVDQQTALFQSSLQLEIDSTIREAVADAVAAILRESRS